MPASPRSCKPALSLSQASIENHQTYDLKRDSWLAKKTLPEKVELDVTTVLLVNEESVRPMAGPVLCEVIGEPIKRLAYLIEEPIKLTGKRALAKYWAGPTAGSASVEAPSVGPVSRLR